VKNQGHDVDSGQFIEQYLASDNEYTLSSDDDYSTDSSDENYYNQKILKLGDISFIWTGIDEKIKAPYIGNSTATYYRKYSPLGTYAKAAKDSLPITQYFTKQNTSFSFSSSNSPSFFLLFLLLLLKNYFPLQIIIVVIVVILLVMIEKLIIFHQNLIN